MKTSFYVARSFHQLGHKGDCHESKGIPRLPVKRVCHRHPTAAFGRHRLSCCEFCFPVGDILVHGIARAVKLNTSVERGFIVHKNTFSRLLFIW